MWRGCGDSARPTGQEVLTPGGGEGAAGGEQLSKPHPPPVLRPQRVGPGWRDPLLSSFRTWGTSQDLSTRSLVPCSCSAGCQETRGRHTGLRMDLPLLRRLAAGCGLAAGVTLVWGKVLCLAALEGVCAFTAVPACARDAAAGPPAGELSSERGRRCRKPPAAPCGWLPGPARPSRTVAAAASRSPARLVVKLSEM